MVPFNPLLNRDVAHTVVKLALFSVGAYYATKYIIQALENTTPMSPNVQNLLEELKLTNCLTKHEQIVANNLIDPKNLSVSWEDIAGLDTIREQIYTEVICPLKFAPKNSEHSYLFQPVKGVILFGPPGCGKTMVAQATAKEAGCRFLSIEISTLTNKWFGESQKLVHALFTLARKIQPCIIFVDEIDALLRQRDGSDHEVTAAMKSQFMQLWDGLSTDKSSQVVVMGATNRAHDIDEAFMRRMPCRIQVGLPDKQKRMKILKLTLQKANINLENIDLEKIACSTDKFSGSDLFEMCRMAYVIPIQEMDRESRQNLDMSKARPLRTEDFLSTAQKFKKSKMNAQYDLLSFS